MTDETKLSEQPAPVTCGEVGDIKEVYKWLDDAFYDIETSRNRMGKTTDVLDRCERVLNTIKHTLSQQPDAELLRVLRNLVEINETYPYIQGDDAMKYVQLTWKEAKQAIARAEQKGGV